ncbi:disease resistance protein L6-like [Rhodamnia argentea]|uniref:Disease resistance protein L6-like n=1 Tax=Rhodamnia argentea TaxID=178133 RepID=A0ABM3HGB9_9MYRT|nr:disease resistance protein L6-like [Rhodamnia argentea]
MRRFVSGRSFAVLAVPILLSVLVFIRFMKKKKSAEKETSEGASSPSSFHPTPAGESSPSSFHPTPAGEGSDRYEVFLSFDGSDTRKEFTDHLYRKLVAAGICVFNHNSIPIGEEFDSRHLDAITRSEISIPIISENYASSKWYLRQLIHIMDRYKSESHRVLPIFYNVRPSDGWHLIGSVGDEKDIQEGRQALEEVCRLKYEEYAIGHEGELGELVVKTVLRKLRKDSPLSVPKELVGLDGDLEEIMESIDIPSGHAKMIEIYGMGGIGKTTFAKCIYNQLWNKFDYTSFLPDIRETTKRHNIEYLQSRLISEILHEEIPVSTVSAGANLIKSRLSGLKVLILLDDIDHKDQVDALAGECNSFASGSIIIVTTTYKHVLYDPYIMWEMKVLDKMNSLILFSRHTFHTDHPSSDLADISQEIVSCMGGIPLLLEIIGSCLYGRELMVWTEVLNRLRTKGLNRLRNVPLGVVQSILEIAYDVLEDRDKENFLDITCFSMFKEGKLAMYMGDSRGSYASHGIEQLKLRGLIKIEDDGKLTMHDQLRNLGWDIIHCGMLPWKYSKLWVDEEAFRGLTGEKGTTMTEAFCCDEFCDDPFSYYANYGSANHLQTYTNGQIKKLRLLRLRDETSSGDFILLCIGGKAAESSPARIFRFFEMHT